MANYLFSLNRFFVTRFLLPVVVVAAVGIGAFAGFLGVASAAPQDNGNDDEPTYELAEGGDLNAINCDYIGVGPEGVAIFRASRDAFLGFDSEVVRDLRTEGLTLVEIGAEYGVNEAWILEEAEKMHAYCLGLELPQDEDNPELVEMMERFDERSENEPDEDGRGGAGLSSGNRRG